MDKPACSTCNERIQLNVDDTWKHMGRKQEHEAAPHDNRTPKAEWERLAQSIQNSNVAEHPWLQAAKRHSSLGKQFPLK